MDKVESNTFCGSNEFEIFSKRINLSPKEKMKYEEVLKTSLMPFSASKHFTELILKL